MDANVTLMEPEIGTEYHDYGENAQLLSFKCISKIVSVQKYKFISRLECGSFLRRVQFLCRLIWTIKHQVFDLESLVREVETSVKRNSSKAHVLSTQNHTEQNHTFGISFDLERTVKVDVTHGFHVLRTFFSRLVDKSEFCNFSQQGDTV